MIALLPVTKVAPRVLASGTKENGQCVVERDRSFFKFDFAGSKALCLVVIVMPVNGRQDILIRGEVA